MSDVTEKKIFFDKKAQEFLVELREKTVNYLNRCNFNKNIVDNLSLSELLYLISENFLKSADLFSYSSILGTYNELLIHHGNLLNQYKNKFLVSTFLCESKIHLSTQEIDGLFNKCSENAKNSQEEFLIIREICCLLELEEM